MASVLSFLRTDDQTKTFSFKGTFAVQEAKGKRKEDDQIPTRK